VCVCNNDLFFLCIHKTYILREFSFPRFCKMYLLCFPKSNLNCTQNVQVKHVIKSKHVTYTVADNTLLCPSNFERIANSTYTVGSSWTNRLYVHFDQ